MPGNHMTAVDAGPVFELCDVHKRFGSLAAVDGLSLGFAKGTTTALIGSSGSGKSTVLRMLVGLVRPDAGEVRFEGRPLGKRDLLHARRKIGYVIQEGGLFPHLTVAGNLALLPRYLGWKRGRIAERVEQLIRLAHLPGHALQRFPLELSGGQRQRVALVRALMPDPPALLLDEPLGALDPIVRHDLQDELREIFERLNKTVVLVTHDVAEAAWLAPRLVLMHEGRLLQEGSCEQLQRQPADAHVRRFLDSARSLPQTRA
jgi:osmoprotectant transport system ATP-binding protein